MALLLRVIHRCETIWSFTISGPCRFGRLSRDRVVRPPGFRRPVGRVPLDFTMAARGEKPSDVRAEQWARTPDSPVASRTRPTTGDRAGGVTTGENRLPLRDSVSFRIAGK